MDTTHSASSHLAPLIHAVYGKTVASLVLIFSEREIVVNLSNIIMMFSTDVWTESGASTVLADEIFTMDGLFSSNALSFAIDGKTHAGMLETINLSLIHI